MDKKVLALLLVSVIVVASLTSCDNTQFNSTQKTGEASITSSMETENLNKMMKVTIWTGMSHNKAFMDEKVNKWNQSVGAEKNIQIDYQVKDDIDYMLEEAFDSGQAPDMFPINDLENYVRKGRVAAIEDLPGGEELIAKFDGTLANYKHCYEGKTYILPTGATTYGLVYNKDMFKAAGLIDENGEARAPETLEELREYARILTNPDKNEYGIVFPGKYSGWYSDGILKVSSATTGMIAYDPMTGLYDYSGVALVMETYMCIKEDGSCLPGVEGLDNDPARSRFSEGGIGMYFSASYDYGVFTDQFPAKIEWGVAPFPSARKDDRRRSIVGYNRYVAINRNSAETKDIDKLMEVYKWLYSDEMIIESYIGGYSLPTNMDLVEDVELDESRKQWKEYADLLEIGIGTPMSMPVDLSGERTDEEIWLEDIWSGKVPFDKIAEVCDRITETYNKGIDKFQELHPDFDSSSFIVSDWDEQSKV